MLPDVACLSNLLKNFSTSTASSVVLHKVVLVSQRLGCYPVDAVQMHSCCEHTIKYVTEETYIRYRKPH